MELCQPSKELTIWELILLNCIVCGMELVASAALVYLPPMLLEAGFAEEYMNWVLGTGPFLCLLFVPMLGQWMDTCRSRHGRRIPFMFAMCVLVVCALVLIPYADHMTSQKDESSSPNIHMYLLAVGVVLIDFGTQAGLTPCEVFLQDITKGSSIRDRAFGLYSLMCSLGSCAGYLILSVNWEVTILGSVFGDQEYCVFFLLVNVFLLLMIINLHKATKIRSRLNIAHNKSYRDLENLSTTPSLPLLSTTKLPAPSRQAAVRRILVACIPRGLRALFSIPYVLRRLVLANFFSWAGVMCFLLFFSDYVGEVVYAGKPSAAVGTDLRLQYDNGVRMGSFGLLLHAIMSSIAAPTIEKLEHRFGMRRIHMIALAVFSVCVCSIMFTNNMVIVTILAMCTGVAFASMTTIPFSLVGMYHENKELYFADTEDPASRGLGVDMASLDTAYFLSQVLLLTITGSIVHLTQTATTYLIMSASLAVISCYFVYTTVFDVSELPERILKRTQQRRHNQPSTERNVNNNVVITYTSSSEVENDPLSEHEL